MTLKKTFKKCKGQSVVEYVAVFTVIVASIFIAFNGFAIEERDKQGRYVGPKIKFTDVFRNVTRNAIAQINDNNN